MYVLKIAVVEAALAFSGNSFQDLTAQMKNERLGNSIRWRGTSRWQALQPCSPGCDTSDCGLIRDRRSSGAFSSWTSLYIQGDSKIEFQPIFGILEAIFLTKLCTIRASK